LQSSTLQLLYKWAYVNLLHPATNYKAEKGRFTGQRGAVL
jgi:hypothetical protein